MSKKILFGILDTIEVFLYLSPDKFITSGLIRRNFPEIKYDTMYKKLRTLLKQGFVEVLEKSGEFAGDDRTAYKLTILGVEVRKGLIGRMRKLLEPYITKIVKEKIEAAERPIIEDKEEQISNFLIEFSGESEGLVDHEVLEQLQKILASLLNKTL